MLKLLSLQGLRKSLEIEYPVKLLVEEKGNSIYLDLIFIDEEKRLRGYGTQVMEKILDYADRYRMRIYLTPSSDYGSNLRRLKKFYKRFNFKRARSRLFSMIREPVDFGNYYN